MNQVNKVTNIDAKRAFRRHIEVHKIIPTIYIDEYWDYYMDLYDLTDQWKEFLKDFIDSGFTYESFYSTYDTLLQQVSDVINSKYDKDSFIEKCKSLLKDAPSTLNKVDSLCNLTPGKYLYVDLRNGFDNSLRIVGLLDDKSVYDIIREATPNKIFYNKKKIRFDVYHTCLPCIDFKDYLYSLESEILLEKIYNQNDPTIEYLNNHFELIGKTNGDAVIYKLNGDEDLKNILGDYSYNGIQYHTETLTVSDITMFGNKYRYLINRDKNGKQVNHIIYSDINPDVHIMKSKLLNISLYPFALKLATGEELNEKDLAVGYEDQIFFHFDKSEII